MSPCAAMSHTQGRQYSIWGWRQDGRSDPEKCQTQGDNSPRPVQSTGFGEMIQRNCNADGQANLDYLEVTPFSQHALQASAHYRNPIPLTLVTFSSVIIIASMFLQN